MILVTGATGTVGREVASLLAEQCPVRVLTRDPGRVCLTGAAVEIVAGHYENPASLHRALQGVRAAFLVTNAPDRDHDAAFVKAAEAAGVAHLVKLSAAAVADTAAQDLITRWQRKTESLIRDSGLIGTFLRPRSFMSNTLSWASTIRTHGEVRALYAHSRNACVAPRDIAEVAVRALTKEKHEGKQYVLTGPQALSAIEQTALLAEAIGRPIRCTELDPEQARSQFLMRYPAPIAEALMQRAQRQEEIAKTAVAHTQDAVLGRPARSFRAWAAEHAAAFS
jgi:uncharacterized protein YbjT (DUF2867 family)